MISIGRHADGLVVPVAAQPGAKRNAILGERAGALRVAVTSPPDKGKANAAVQSMLAQCLGLKAGQITLLTGQTSRQKRFVIAGINPAELERRLNVILSGPGSSRTVS